MPSRPSHAFLSGGGKLGARIADFDWSATPLGPIEVWPQSLKTATSLILRSPVPLVMLWGEDGIMIYNDAYSVFAGQRDPKLLGSKVREGWPEVADFNDHIMKVGLAGGTLAYRDQELILSRYGAPERVYLNLDYSPVLDEGGNPAGVIAVVVEITEKIKAERKLAGERESLRRMFEQAPGFISMLSGPDHVFTMVNAAYSQLIGNRDVIGKPIAEALPEVGSQGFIALLDRVYRTGEPYFGEGVRLLLEQTPGNPPEEHYVDFIYQPIATHDGTITGIFVQGHDVTGQKRNEHALRESEERFRLVAENAPVMLWMSDSLGGCVYLNEAQRNFWGVALDRLSEFEWGMTIHPDDRGALYQQLGAALAAKTGFSGEMRLKRSDGVYRIIRTTAQPRFSGDGDYLGMIGVNVDMTETRDAEAALRRETRLMEVVNKTCAAIAAELDSDRLVQMVTDAGVELTGAEFGAFFYNVLNEKGESYMLYALSGVPREKFADFPMPRATAVFRPTFKGEGVVRSDDILHDPRYGKNAPYRGMPAGHLPVRSYLAVPVISRSGDVLGGLFFGHGEPARFKPEDEKLLLGIAGQAATAIDNARLFQSADRELGERRRAEEALMQLNATLEQRVADEVAERSRAEETLRQAQKMDSIGKLTGGVAHDFNNLLQVVSGNLQLLQKDLAGNDRAERRVANALAGVSRGAKLASQLLAFGRRQALEPKVVNIGRLIFGVEDMLRRTIGEGIEIETIVSGGLWNTFIDPGQLENAILNLAINARDAMNEVGKLTIEIGNAYLDDAYADLHADIQRGQYVVLAVTDTGSGMTPEVMAQAFEPFFSTKPLGKGTGLGLSMVYGFVKQSGGHVKIYSEIGEGTTIKIYLPRAHQSEDLKTAITPGAVLGGSETILVAEDEEEVRNTVVEMLSDLGYHVLTAKDAVSALSVIESGIPVDLLFTDVVMPGTLKSPELARKARERLPGIGVLFTSGYTENSIVHGGRLDPGVELISKPYTREALARKVRHVLGNTVQRRNASIVDGMRESADSDALPHLAGLKVLLCEDDALIRMTTADMLQDLGMIVFEAASAEDALAFVRSDSADLVIADIGLPDMPGTDLALHLRQILPSVPILFATGRDEVADLESFTPATMVTKPYDEKALRQSIEKLVFPKG